jgi:hypothetical protein
LNNQLVFSKNFGSGKWLDNSEAERTYTVQSSELTASPYWSMLTLAKTLEVLDTGIPRNTLESIITAHVANAIHGKRVKWGHIYGRGAVEVSRRNSNNLAVDLDLKLDVPHWFDPIVDVDFDIRLCKNNQPSFEVTNQRVHVDSRWYSEVLSLSMINIVDALAQCKISQSLRHIGHLGNIQIATCPIATASGGIMYPRTNLLTIPQSR